MSDTWYELQHPEKIDSPALLVYRDRARENIRRAIAVVGNPDRLRPHVKTNKSIEACRLMMDAGIGKFKAATISEVEMLVRAGASDILLAYQPVGPKIDRLFALIQKYPEVQFHCLTDHEAAAEALDAKAREVGQVLSVYVDLNAGTNRTGIIPGPAAVELVEKLLLKSGLSVKGFHLYDGHLRNPVFEIRTAECEAGFAPIASMRERLEETHHLSLEVIAGGTTTFPIHAARQNVICAPGTFIYWDEGYATGLPEQEFLYAALVMSRVISLPAENLVCVDLGHKAIASENPIDKRVRFLNGTDLSPISQSEEHLVLQAAPGHSYKIGDLLYGVPYHICPTVALHQEAVVVENGEQVAVWKTLSRDRKITY